jgi:RNA polymerase sigma factor (sigma-70 family)
METRQLSPGRQSLVLQYLPLADRLAMQFRGRLNREERLSAAQFGLCKAAFNWPEEGEFEPYAARCIRDQLRHDEGQLRMSIGQDRYSRGRIHINTGQQRLPERGSPAEAVDDEDELANRRRIFQRELRRMPHRRRRAMQLAAGGRKLREIGEEMGVSWQSADQFRRLGIAQMRGRYNRQIVSG